MCEGRGGVKRLSCWRKRVGSEKGREGDNGEAQHVRNGVVRRGLG